jgi:transketolase C-terminal domain/subunit
VFVAEEHNTLGGVATVIANMVLDAGLNDVQLILISVLDSANGVEI